MKFPITGQRLIDMIPQKPPFVLISSLNELSENHAVTDFTFTQDHVLCHNRKLTTAGLLENIAQTAAAKAGYECVIAGKKIPIGFIGDVRHFSFTKLPAAGDTITTEIIITHRIFEVSVVSGTIKLNNEIIASCNMKIFVEPEEKEET